MKNMTTNLNLMKRVTWESVHFTTDSASQIAQQLHEQVPPLHVIKAAPHPNQHLMDRVAAVLSFPSYFGRNWDAFDECLKDLSWISFQGLVLIIEDSSQIWSSETKEAGMLTSIWLAAAQQWAEEQKPFHLVFSL